MEYDPSKSKTTFIYVAIGVLVLIVIGIIGYIVTLEEDPDAPAPALTDEDVRAILSENNSQLSAADIATIVAAGNSGSNGMSTTDLADILAQNNESNLEQILQFIEERSDDGDSDGNISDFTPDSSICGDSDNEYVDASGCSDITNGKKCGDGDGKGGRWVRKNKDSTKELCKWKNNKCVYHKDCGSNSDSGYNTERSDENEKVVGREFNSGKCKDVRQYKKAYECKYINKDNDSKAEEKCREGRWVEKSDETAVLCKWDNNECVTDSECDPDDQADINFCQKMINEKGVIPTGVEGKEAYGGTMNDDERSDYTTKNCNEMHEDGKITYTPADAPNSGGGSDSGREDDSVACKLLVFLIREKLEAVKEIKEETIPDIEGEKSGTCRLGGNCTKDKERGRKTFRNNLKAIISEMDKKLKVLECKEDENTNDENIQPIVDKIKEFNAEFIQEKEESESEEYTGKGYSNVDIEFEDINWPFENVKSRDDLEAVLNNSESFKNYEPYHNGNSRSSRKVPKPYDEHFVNFRSY